MLQNKIYQNFLKEIFKTFLVILFGLSLIALTVRSVSFLDLIVDSGYPVGIYFKYSLLNLFGITPKFIPLSFLLALTIFILKHVQDSEFVILWTSGVKKIQVTNLFLSASILVLVLYLLFSIFLTPFALNKSRMLLSNENFNSFLPTIKTQQFSDSFDGFTFLVEKKINNEIKNIFLFDKGNNLKNLSSNISENHETTILAKSGIIEEKKMFLFNGQIISSKKNIDNDVVSFEQLSINLDNLSTSTIKQPKIQEISTRKLLKCFTRKELKLEYCSEDFKKEILPTISRRLVIPFYIPVISLICSLLIVRSSRIYYNKIGIFFYGFALLVFSELSVRYTGLNNTIFISFILLPIILITFIYSFLIYKFSKEWK